MISLTRFRQFRFQYILCFFIILCISCQSQKKLRYKPDSTLLQTIEQNFKDAADQYKLLAKNLPAGKFPKTFFPVTGQYEFSGSGWWCSGFYPGSLLYLYEQS